MDNATRRYTSPDFRGLASDFGFEAQVKETSTATLTGKSLPDYQRTSAEDMLY